MKSRICLVIEKRPSGVEIPLAAFPTEEMAYEYIESEKRDPDGMTDADSRLYVEFIPFFSEKKKRGLDELREAYGE